MKIFTFLLLVLVLPITLNAQKDLSEYFPLKDGKIFYSDVIQVDGILKEELSKRVQIWLAYRYDAITFNDNNTIIARGYVNTYIWHTVKIQVKDGRCKYEFTNFRAKEYISSSGSSFKQDEPLENYRTFGNRLSTESYDKIDSRIREHINSFVNAMNTPIDENW